MRKKYLSALLFGALLVTSAGTFTSCKDYDDEINDLQGQITDLQTAVKSLEDLVNAGKYVTAVEKTADGIKFTFNQGDPVTIALEEADQEGQVFELKDGEIYVDGNPTGIKPAKDPEKAPVKVENGVWMFLNAEGEYESTNIPVSGINVSGSKEDGYVLEIFDANGNSQKVELPSAASLITSITTSTGENLEIQYATFSKPSDWKGKGNLPENGSVIFISDGIDVRVNPVSAPATEVDYYLTNAKNENLSNVILKAASTDIGDGLTIEDANSRAAYNGNGLYTLSMERVTLSRTAGENFIKEFKKVGFTSGEDRNKAIAFAVNANSTTRSAYDVAVKYDKANALSSIRINKENEVSFGNGTFTVKVGETNHVYEGTKEQEGLLLDMYFTVNKTDKETYGIEFDDLNRTFKVTKNPDVSTSATGFDLTITTIDIHGNKKSIIYKVKLSTEVSADVTYDAVTVDLSKKFAGTGNNKEVISLDKMVESLGNSWASWANSVDLLNTEVVIATKSDMSDGKDIKSYPQFGNSDLVNEDGTPANVNNLTSYLLELVKDPEIAEGNNTVLLDTQYYLGVTFKTKEGEKVNSIIVPITFTAPSVSDLMEAKAGYVDAETGSIFAYYTGGDKNITLSKYFDKFIKDANYTLKNDDKVYTVGNTDYSSNDLAVINNINKQQVLTIKQGTEQDPEAYILNDGTNREFAYGKQLTVYVSKDNYLGWKYKTDSKNNVDSFTITVLSPIFEGKIASTTGTSINVIANNETGFPITADMISLTDYANNKYNVVPDNKENTDKNPSNDESNDIDVWSSDQINNVYVTKGENNTYISDIKLTSAKYDGNGKLTEAGAIVVYGDVTVSDSVETEMTVNVVDAWGYVTSQVVKVTIVKNK